MMYKCSFLVLLSGSSALFGGDDIQYSLTCTTEKEVVAYQLFEGTRFIAVSPDLKSIEDKYPGAVARAISQQHEKISALEYTMQQLKTTNAQLMGQNKALTRCAEEADRQVKAALYAASEQKKIFDQTTAIAPQLIEALEWYQSKFRMVRRVAAFGVVVGVLWLSLSYSWYQGSGNQQ